MCLKTKRNQEQSAAEKRAAAEALRVLREAATVFAANEEEKLRVRKEVAKEFADIQLEQAVRFIVMTCMLLNSSYICDTFLLLH